MSPRHIFTDRADAGRLLASLLHRYRADAPVVVGISRGGMLAADVVATRLGAPLDVCIVRKLGAPTQPTLAIGAVAEGGFSYVDQAVVALIGVPEEELSRSMAQKQREVESRIVRFRRGAAPVDLRGRTVLLIDDGIATGASARVAIQSVRARGATHVVLAAPVGAAEALHALAATADEIVCPHREYTFFSVGLWYDDFTSTSDEDVAVLLERRRAEAAAAGEEPTARRRSEPVPTGTREEFRISLANTTESLIGTLSVPRGAAGLVVFAHGCGDPRLLDHDRTVSTALEESGLGTLSFELLTAAETRLDARTGSLRFDVDVLAARLLAVTERVLDRPALANLRLGYFGASTGAAAALAAAAAGQTRVFAVVCCCGRIDLARDALARVRAPTLLVVARLDEELLALNQLALMQLGCVKELAVVEEASAMEEVGRLASNWFARYLTPSVSLAATA